MSKSETYEEALTRLQIGLVQTQIHTMAKGTRIVIVMEGRDGAGKDGAIHRITEHLSSRNTRVVSLPKPSDRERGQWWFQRYVRHLPAVGEWVLFNRSWYNRGGVEPVMGFCTPQEHDNFLRDAPGFEAMLVESGIVLVKFWLDITKAEQAHRIESRRKDPLKALKISPMDDAAQKKWAEYGAARDQMLSRTHTALAPWICVCTDDKKAARLNVIRHLLHVTAPAQVAAELEAPDPAILFPFESDAVKDGRLTP